jgi:hypothetical protein
VAQTYLPGRQIRRSRFKADPEQRVPKTPSQTIKAGCGDTTRKREKIP